MDLVIIQLRDVLGNPQGFKTNIMGNHTSLSNQSNQSSSVSEYSSINNCDSMLSEISDGSESFKSIETSSPESDVNIISPFDFSNDTRLLPNALDASDSTISEEIPHFSDNESEMEESAPKDTPASLENDQESTSSGQVAAFEMDQFFDEIDSSPNTSACETFETCKELSVAALYSHRSLRKMCREMGLAMRLPPMMKNSQNFTSNRSCTKSFSGANYSSLVKPVLKNDGDDDDSSTEEYDIEGIVDYSLEKGVEWYLVKWRNWSSDHNTWEPKSHLEGCEDLVEEFHSSKSNRKRKNLFLSKDSIQSKKLKLVTFISDICKKSSNPDIVVLLKLGNRTLNAFTNTRREITELKDKIMNKYIACSRDKQTRNLRRLMEEENDMFGEDGIIEFVEKRKEVLKSLNMWEKQMNTFYGKSRIMVENFVDLEGPPKDFTYITHYIPGEGVVIPDDPLVGCQCSDCLENAMKCCPGGAGAKFAYYKNGLVSVPAGSPIYECNKLCSCSPNCPNRVVQKGQKVNVIIFRTDDGRGWGVKSMEKIRKGTFVMEYNGEVITNEEAERRGTLYDGEGRTYLFDLDYDESIFTVDAAYYGNAAHFINHSCNPNLHVYGVWVEHLDTRIPRIAFFARREIKKYEELTFDYRMTTTGPQSPKKSQDPTNSATDHNDLGTSSSSRNLYRIKPIQCKCGSSNCRRFLF